VNELGIDFAVEGYDAVCELLGRGFALATVLLRASLLIVCNGFLGLRLGADAKLAFAAQLGELTFKRGGLIQGRLVAKVPGARNTDIFVSQVRDSSVDAGNMLGECG
jgi:hypothetical protein